MNRKRLIFLIAMIAFLILFFVFAVPIIINECYKCATGYITIWGAEDVLSYYGTILGMVLGAVVTFGSLYITISFTKRQIRKEDYTKNEREKWTKIESLFNDVLYKINPLHPMEKILGTDTSNLSEHIKTLQQYQINSKLTMDMLLIYLTGIVDYPKVRTLYEKIVVAIENFSEIYDRAIESYSKLYDFEKSHFDLKEFNRKNQF